MVHLALLWHMHQPWYGAPDGAGLELPWVRLHGVKDYLDMALRVEASPRVRVAFNVVPSLLAQIDAYAGGASDSHLVLSRRDPEHLTQDERASLLESFFPGRSTRLGGDMEGYRRLRAKRDALRSQMRGSELASRFSDQEILDAQVFWNLAWVDPMFHGEPEVAALAGRSGGFTLEERDALLGLHGRLLARIIPALRRLDASGQAELTTSPYYHPILPLLCDTESARPGLPGAPLPMRRFRRPEDARRHVSLAVEDHERRFGRKPAGAWPSEGSVSDESAAVLAGAGFQWIASDEEILFRSLGHAGEAAGGRGQIYQPFRLETASGPVSIVFRDKQLSDLVGFTYMRWSPRAAAEDFIERVMAAGRSASAGNPPLVTVILDGENCWEYYEKDGGPFLDELYGRLSREPGLVMTTPGRYLSEHAPRATLRGLFPGSWIDHSFHMWIGEPAKNQAWDHLAAAREAYAEAEAEGSGDLEGARRLLDVAEGSDWFWWYAASPHGPSQPAFDRIFREYLRETYRALGTTPPRELLEPIAGGVSPFRPPESAPVGLIQPVIDGAVTTFYEWAHGGHVSAEAGGAAMARASLYVMDFYYGFDLSTFFCRVDFTDRGRLEASDLSVVLEFAAPNPVRLEVPLSKVAEPGKVRLVRPGRAPEERGRACLGRVLELAAPFDDLAVSGGQEVWLACHVMREGKVLESFPPHGHVSFRAPNADFEETMWSA